MQCAKFLSRAGLASGYILPVMAIGQFCEMLMYVVLAKLLPKLGYRKIIAIGIIAFAARFFLFGTVGLPLAAMIAGQAIHGLCYAFFFSACFIYVDRVAPKDIRNSAQALYNFVFYGVGPICAVGLNNLLVKTYMREEDTLTLQEFSMYWYTLGGITIAALIIFLIAFRVAPEKTDMSTPETRADSLNSRTRMKTYRIGILGRRNGHGLRRIPIGRGKSQRAAR